MKEVSLLEIIGRSLAKVAAGAGIAAVLIWLTYVMLDIGHMQSGFTLPNPATDFVLLDWNSANLTLLVMGGLFALVQFWWIAALLRRNRRRRGAEPLSNIAFRQELDRIFRESPRAGAVIPRQPNWCCPDRLHRVVSSLKNHS